MVDTREDARKTNYKLSNDPKSKTSSGMGVPAVHLSIHLVKSSFPGPPGLALRIKTTCCAPRPGPSQRTGKRESWSTTGIIVRQTNWMCAALTEL